MGRPLIIVIDQYEKLVLSEEGTLAAGNAGLIHSLIEVVPRENGMCVIAGNEEAWEALPRDLKGRFAGNVIDFPLLRPEEASEMIRLYLTPAAEEFQPRSGISLSDLNDQLFPFNSDAVQKIVSYCAGNIRRLLQITCKVFEAALPERQLITTNLVDKVLQQGNLAYYSYANVLDEIERVLANHSLRFKRAFRIGSVETDLAVIDADGKAQLLIEINEATFHEQEAKRALETLNRVQACPPAPLVVDIVLSLPRARTTWLLLSDRVIIRALERFALLATIAARRPKLVFFIDMESQ